MTKAQTDQLNKIVQRWTKANHNKRLDDWQSLCAWIDSRAAEALVRGRDYEHASDLDTLGELAYWRSVEFMDAGQTRLICEVA